MKGYPIIGVFWRDHYTAIASDIPDDPDSIVDTPTLTVGILLRETESSLLVAHDIERGRDIDHATYTVILKGTIVGDIQQYGKIKLKNLRFV